MRTLRSPRRRPPAVVPIRILLVAALVAFTLAPTGTQAAPAHQASERQFLELMNASRRAHGRRALVASPAVAKIARAWSRRMAADGRLRHNPNVSRQLTVDWRRWGENVGWASNRSDGPLRTVTRRLHRSFMESDGHRANILGRYNQVGVGVAVDDEGTMWATMVFVDGPIAGRSARSTPRRTAAGLSDIGRSPHRAEILSAWQRDLIAPCEARRFCPHRAVRRAEVATVIARMLELPPGTSGHFDDVDANAGAINALAAEGIVEGCGPRRFCPDAAVTRAQLASLLVRALPALRPTPGSRFADLPPGYVHSDAINALARAGVTRGCDARRFCPTARVTREQLAAFVVRALRV